MTAPFKSPVAAMVCAWTRNHPRTITVLIASLVAVGLAGCPSGSRPRPGPGAGTVPSPSASATSAPAAAPAATPHLGRPYDLVPGESVITILAYRGGALAKAGHNHVIASHDLSGAIYVPDELLRTSIQVRMPVAGLTVDEASLRAKEGPDFAAEVADSAKEGTRHNMLSEALLSAADNPEIVLESERLEGGGTVGSSGSADGSGNLTAHIRVTIRKAAHSITVPLHYELHAPDRVAVSGELAIKQSDLGLTPFSALMGALQVQDEIKVKFQLSAKATGAH